jgi:hypothetical protein|tara:strand:+ start:2020 stop:2340 length:321 start_codon:yes stop_codon:yes gene_type:complete
MGYWDMVYLLRKTGERKRAMFDAYGTEGILRWLRIYLLTFGDDLRGGDIENMLNRINHALQPDPGVAEAGVCDICHGNDFITLSAVQVRDAGDARRIRQCPVCSQC